MNVSPEKMLSAFRNTAEVRIHELATASDGLLSGVEHLTALNLNTGRALLDETIAFTQAAAAARVRLGPLSARSAGAAKDRLAGAAVVLR